MSFYPLPHNSYCIYRKYSDRQSWANNVDLDETPQNVASHQVLHCLPVIQRFLGGVWVVRRCPLSYITIGSNWYWLTVGQGLLSLQQVRVEGKCLYFFCFFTFIPVLLSSLALSFVPVPSLSSLLLSFLLETTQNDPQRLNHNTSSDLWTQQRCTLYLFN